MSYTIDKTEQLSDAVKKGYKARASQLRAEGVPTKQHNVGVTKSEPKKAAAKTPAKKSTAKKTAAKKSTASKTAAKKTTTKKS